MPQKEKSVSLADQAYETIKTNILNMTYPPGMTLTESRLARDLGMSRSPVRTAIRMLQTEGLIVTDYYKSMTVKEITELPAPGASGGSRLPAHLYLRQK